MKIAVIGAGSAGLAALRHCTSGTYEIICYEKTDRIGGTWVYREEIGLDRYGLAIHTSMYKNLRTNLPKEVMGYPDYLVPDSPDSYLTRTQILEFLNSYCDHFKLRQHIWLLHNVELVEPSKGGRKWTIKVRNLKENIILTESFDAVMVCNGHYFEPSIPNLKGQETFQGQQLHSHDYRVPDIFTDKTIVVLGAGPSGMDLALEISGKAKRVILSHHLKDPIGTIFPENVVQKPDIKEVTKHDVVFEDGSKEPVDVLFYCTGYKYSFPFLSEQCGIRVDSNMVTPLWKHLVSIENPTLALVGLPFYVCAFSMFDLQDIKVVLKKCKMAAKTEDTSIDNTNDGESMDKEVLAISGSDETNHRIPPTYLYNSGSEQNTGLSNQDQTNRNRTQATEDQLGPLPPNWEKAYTDTGEVYFIDHNTGTSHWLDPRLSKFQKRSLEECLDDELPYGWEKIDDTLYGTYFIDHVNRRTQYENPVLQAKRAQQSLGERKSPNFTRNPDKLKGQRIRTTLIKSSRGLGFTIVGGDDSVEEFLQIKSVVPNGPAWLDGKLQTGDVLVYVNDTCVLGFTHNEMVNVFKSISSGETVALEVCRGYPLPFDPNDPNTEVVTTIAVNAPDILTEDSRMYMDLNPALQSNGRFNFLDSTFMPVHSLQNGENLATTSVNSMPDLCISDKINTIKRPSSTDILLSESNDLNDCKDSSMSSKSEFLSIAIVKGTMGFGFTIADSAHGQKVKKILDRQRCKNLMEGDILVNINDINVRNMCHSEVVQVLKDCARNEEALIHVQRTTSKSNEKKEKNSQDFFRSKTPTADIYSTQTKTVVPSRPKTPLIDTRIRPKSPPNAIRSNWNEQSENELNPLDNRYKYSEYTHSMYYNDPYKANIANLSDNFVTMTNLDDESVRNGVKRDWVTNDKLNISNDVYSIDIPHHDNMLKQNGCLHSDYYKDLYTSQSHSQYSEQDYNVYSIGQEQNVDTGEIWDKRKETTSFEHEQPHSSSIPRYPQYSNELVCPIVPDIEWIETLVTLVRQDTGFGFRIVGGTEEGSQVSVGHIVPGGAADLDNRLNTGDLIMSVDGESVMNSSHHHVVQLMIAAAQNGRVTLGIRRRINTQENLPENLQTSYNRQMNLQYPYDVTVTRMENEGFGFVIISSVNKAGSTIGRIIEGSPAERCGRLNVGDHILAVNHVDITNVCHKDIVNLIKDSGYSVTLTIGYPLDDCCSNTSLSQKDELTCDGDGGQYHAVELTRGTRGFGFSIRGGREFQNMPLFVLQIAENGPASIDNRLRVGDQIIEINGINTKNMTHTEAIEIIRNGGPSVRLLVRRGCQMPSVSNLTIDQISIRPIDEGTPRRHLLKLHEMGVYPKKRQKVRFFILLNCCSSKNKYL